MKVFLLLLRTMAYNNMAIKRFYQPCGEPFGTKNGAVLAARAAETDTETGKIAFLVFRDGSADDGARMGEERLYGGVSLQELDNRKVLARIAPVLGETAGIGECAAVEDKSSSVAGRVVGKPLFVGETVDGHGKAGVFELRVES